MDVGGFWGLGDLLIGHLCGVCFKLLFVSIVVLPHVVLLICPCGKIKPVE